MNRDVIPTKDSDQSGRLLPVSEAVLWHGLVFVSGQTAPEVPGFEGQAKAVLKKIGVVLKASGSDYQYVLRCGVYLADGSMRERMNAIYRDFFPERPPARTTIECKLSRDTLLEVDCVAILPS